jgi:hypothetical protein
VKNGMSNRAIRRNTSSKKFRILAVIPSLPKDLNPHCVPSVLAQTYPVKMLVILPEKISGGTLPERVSLVLNNGLSHINLVDFDYVLRIDGDTVLPTNFLEECLRQEPDLWGDWGYAMLIKTKTFLKLMDGKFHPESDDSYIIHKFIAENCKVVKGQASVQSRKRRHDAMDLMACGRIYYKLGYEPFHVLNFLKNRQPRDILLVIIGYFGSLVRHESKFDVADFIWRHQVKRLFSGTISFNS